MGIKNLLKIIDVMQTGQLEDFADKVLGVDGYSWIHKAIYNNGHELVVQKEKSSYFKKVATRIAQLTKYRIRIVLVFDGDKLPSKSGTEEIRETNRCGKRTEANLLLQQGRHEEANKKFAESFDVTPQLAFETLQFLKSKFPETIECRFSVIDRHCRSIRSRCATGILEQDWIHRRSHLGGQRHAGLRSKGSALQTGHGR